VSGRSPAPALSLACPGPADKDGDGIDWPEAYLFLFPCPCPLHCPLEMVVPAAASLTCSSITWLRATASTVSGVA
jgi:hypothetical protein